MMLVALGFLLTMALAAIVTGAFYLATIGVRKLAATASWGADFRIMGFLLFLTIPTFGACVWVVDFFARHIAL